MIRSDEQWKREPRETVEEVRSGRPHGIGKCSAVLLALLVVVGGLLFVTPTAKAPFMGLDVTPGAYSNSLMLGDPYVYAPGETISYRVRATASEVYDITIVVTSTGLILYAEDDVVFPPWSEISREFTVPATVRDGFDYEIEVGDQNWIETNRGTTEWASRRFAVQEYVFRIATDRVAYLGGDDVTLRWSANKLLDGSLASPGNGQIWVYNQNGAPLLIPFPFTFTAPAGSMTFTLDNQIAQNFAGRVEGWFNSSAAPPARHQWTCASRDYSTPVDEGVCYGGFEIGPLRVRANVRRETYRPEGIVTVDVRTVVDLDRRYPFRITSPEPFMLVSIAVWDITSFPAVNKTQYAAAGLHTDAQGELTYLFQLDAGIKDRSLFEVRVNATQPNGIQTSNSATKFTVEAAVGFSVKISSDRNEYQAGDTIVVDALVFGHPGGVLTYIFQARADACYSGPLLDWSTQNSPTFSYKIGDNFDGMICIQLTVDDGKGNEVSTAGGFFVVLGWLFVSSDRPEYTAGSSVTFSWRLISNRIDPNRVKYFYEVQDLGGNIVTQGVRDATVSFIRFDIPSPPSSKYSFRITAGDGELAVSNSVDVFERSGFFLTVAFDRSSYRPGDRILATYRLTPRSATSVLPKTLNLRYGLVDSPGSRWPHPNDLLQRVNTPRPSGALIYVVPGGIDEGDKLFRVIEEYTRVDVWEVVTIDGTAPILGVPSVSGARAGVPIVVTVTATDAEGLRLMLLRWNIVGGVGGTVPMAGGSTGVYVAILPAPESEGELELRVAAEDLAGNAASTAPIRVFIEPDHSTGPSGRRAPPSSGGPTTVDVVLASIALAAVLIAAFQSFRRRRSPPPT